MTENKVGFGAFALRHPYITWFMFGCACDAVVKIVRGYPDSPLKNVKVNVDGEGNVNAEEISDDNDEVEVVSDDSITVEEA